ncbi:uncharacterized protein B0I36DRAFT_96946 [Microdochium trichocladiopsis]|uniref:Zn(2)-C6 fungal-type domain-containing protein n=1 Tax=Microdochium trichocladiopsis TaxID=1682393 RepID=A0A9P8YD84_9PEZI|nr:uncharacterized protein B0I36DRAFT_96946 [Microdochium trichocladiopsis]KAH7035800.1 hypothetical protein B0I36DRAFT_96946 [Microdochium trichocladiopsis]
MAASEAQPPSKSKRVRTGCLTCRERHLKCDEGTPDCLNCRKSNRECKRGVRLNFIDMTCKQPPFIFTTPEWSIQFQDESRLIASEYRGGLAKYRHLAVEPASVQAGKERTQYVSPQVQIRPNDNGGLHIGPTTSIDQQGFASGHGLYHNERLGQVNPDLINDARYHSGAVVDQAFMVVPGGAPSDRFNDQPYDIFAHSSKMNGRDNSETLAGQKSGSASTTESVAGMTPNLSLVDSRRGSRNTKGIITPPREKSGDLDHISSPEQLRLMQVFVSEVGVWMDSLDPDKHFSRLVPYHALKCPMLLNALLACGVKYLTLIQQDSDDKALFYYDTATTQLLRSLQNPERNTAECAATAVVLNVYEIMSEKPTQRMSHIAGARALIRECNWNARSTGLGAACFWLNVGMELLSCLAFNWQTAWEPDQWGLEMDLTVETTEEGWVHRLFYLVAKIANFRANIPKFQEASPHDEQIRLQARYAEWQRLKHMCDSWHDACPPTMHPLGVILPSQQTGPSKSLFPNVWIIKRAATVGRLYYHTAQCLLAQMNPLSPRNSEEAKAIQLHHAHQVCGITAHTQDHGVASVSIRSVALVAEVIEDHAEQQEIAQILEKIDHDTGWKLAGIIKQLRSVWGWEKMGQSGGLVASATLQPPRNPGTPNSLSSRGSSHGAKAENNGPQQRLSAPTAYTAMSYGNGHQHGHLNGMQPRQQQGMQQTEPSMQPLGVTALPSAPPVSADSPISRRGSMAVATSTAPVAAPRPMRVNPLSFADFSLPNHPYQNWYEPPSRAASNITYQSQTLFR